MWPSWRRDKCGKSEPVSDGTFGLLWFNPAAGPIKGFGTAAGPITGARTTAEPVTGPGTAAGPVTGVGMTAGFGVAAGAGSLQGLAGLGSKREVWQKPGLQLSTALKTPPSTYLGVKLPS